MAENNNFTFTWTIENSSQIMMGALQYLESPVLETDDGTNQWNLRISHKNDATVNEPTCVCMLRRIKGFENYSLRCKVQIKNFNGKVIFSEENCAMKLVREGRNNFYPLFAITCKDLVDRMKVRRYKDNLTIYCMILIKNPKAGSSDFKVKSKIGLNHVTFAWCVGEPTSVEWCQRKAFFCTETTSIEISLTAPEEDILFAIKKASKVSTLSEVVSVKITLIDNNNEELMDNTYNISESDDWQEFPMTISKVFLLNLNCILNGFFTLVFEFLAPNGIIISELENSTVYNINSQINLKCKADATTILQSNYKKMLLDHKHSDVSLRAGGKVFRAHKCVLASRSPVFQAMFDSEMLEKETNVVEIKDFNLDTLDELLKFLYTGACDVGDCESTLKLMLAADKYQVESLIDECAKILTCLLSEKNACDIIAVANMVKHNVLKASAFELIEECAENILSSTEWLEWSTRNIHLAFEITSKLALQACKEKMAVNNSEV